MTIAIIISPRGSGFVQFQLQHNRWTWRGRASAEARQLGGQGDAGLLSLTSGEGWPRGEEATIRWYRIKCGCQITEKQTECVLQPPEELCRPIYCFLIHKKRDTNIRKYNQKLKILSFMCKKKRKKEPVNNHFTRDIILFSDNEIWVYFRNDFKHLIKAQSHITASKDVRS